MVSSASSAARRNKAAVEAAEAARRESMKNYGDVIIAPFLATDDVYDDPEFKGTATPMKDAPLSQVSSCFYIHAFILYLQARTRRIAKLHAYDL